MRVRASEDVVREIREGAVGVDTGEGETLLEPCQASSAGTSRVKVPNVLTASNPAAS